MLKKIGGTEADLQPSFLLGGGFFFASVLFMRCLSEKYNISVFSLSLCSRVPVL